MRDISHEKGEVSTRAIPMLNIVTAMLLMAPLSTSQAGAVDQVIESIK